MGSIIRKKSIVALQLDGGVLEVTKWEGGAFSSKKISGEVAEQRLALDRLAKGALVVTGLGGAKLLFRMLEIPLKEKRAILKALPFQLESIIPYPLEEALILPLIRSKGKVKIFATQKKCLEEHLLTWESYFVQPEFVSVHFQALWRFALKTGRKDITLLHLGVCESSLLLIKGGELVAAVSLAFGGTTAETEVKKELFRSLRFLGSELPPFLITGCPREGFCEMLSGLVENISWILDETIQEQAPFALTIGLVLDSAALDRESVQLQTPSAHLARIKKKFALFASLLCLYLLVFSLVGRGIVRGKEQSLQRRRQELSLRCKQELGVLPNRLGKVAIGSPLEHEGPLVSDLLNYLATLPELQQGIVIERVHYRLESYPTTENPRAKYLTKVELDISADSSEIANRFYEKIRKEQKNVRWQRHENGYQIAFTYA